MPRHLFEEVYILCRAYAPDNVRNVGNLVFKHIHENVNGHNFHHCLQGAGSFESMYDSFLSQHGTKGSTKLMNKEAAQRVVNPILKQSVVHDVKEMLKTPQAIAANSMIPKAALLQRITPRSENLEVKVASAGIFHGIDTESGDVASTENIMELFREARGVSNQVSSNNDALGFLNSRCFRNNRSIQTGKITAHLNEFTVASNTSIKLLFVLFQTLGVEDIAAELDAHTPKLKNVVGCLVAVHVPNTLKSILQISEIRRCTVVATILGPTKKSSMSPKNKLVIAACNEFINPLRQVCI